MTKYFGGVIFKIQRYEYIYMKNITMFPSMFSVFSLPLKFINKIKMRYMTNLPKLNSK